MGRNPGSGVKTDGRNRLQMVGTWRQERNSLNVFVTETKTNCVLCKGNNFHPLSKCYQFKKLSVEDRVAVVKQNNLCFRCFLPHRLKECRSEKNCFCLRPHNSLIHFSRDKTRNPTSNLNLDAPTFVPGQIEGLVEANSQSQFVATGTLQQLAKDGKSRFSLASETLLFDTYMDIVSGAPDLETAQQLQSQLKDALQSCGMNLHKWSSNSPELLNSSLSSDIEHSFSTDIDLSVKTLGISWKPFEDCFVFKVSVSAKHIYTKREVLSVIAKLYDPLGFLGPVIAKAKVFLQQLWQCKLDWDDVLPNSIANEWRKFVTTLKCIEEVKINRFIMADHVRIILQGFADASKRPTEWSFTYTLVANRVAKVQELTEGFQWNHVPSVLNAADLVSRGLRPCDLPNLRLWWHGPQFLEKDSDGLLRVGGRLSNSDLPYVNKHPAILPGNHNLTVQIVAHFHRKNLHTGASSLLHYMQLEVDRLLKVNKELSHRNRHLQKQMYTLVEEKSDLQANMQNQQKECLDLQARLDVAVKENMDLSSFEDQKKMDLHGKLIISLDDPNRPRFTLDELRHILFERNDLKAKISDLEDELSLHKPKRIPSSTSLATLSVGSEEEDLPVQGPINKEPEDKLYPEKRKLGIRRFFPTVTWPKLM
ncbi:integrase catalytic domain-containing protein [Trichonephila clavipes]|nr:integrase catalytic domain-containing protein [Trichonephila clavipes]